MKTKKIMMIIILICLSIFIVTHLSFAHGDGNHIHSENEIGRFCGTCDQWPQ
ncbi:MAG: hypothetical protein GY860_09185 [Desulfobacteraceae bacterium]|nr:hypothetical protein [Desulfobacteraceae bacterium]